MTVMIQLALLRAASRVTYHSVRALDKSCSRASLLCDQSGTAVCRVLIAHGSRPSLYSNTPTGHEVQQTVLRDIERCTITTHAVLRTIFSPASPHNHHSEGIPLLYYLYYQAQLDGMALGLLGGCWQTCNNKEIYLQCTSIYSMMQCIHPRRRSRPCLYKRIHTGYVQ